MVHTDIVVEKICWDIELFDPNATYSFDGWLEERKKYITCTETATVLGLHPYNSCADMILSKRGLLPPIVETEAMTWGKRLERVVAEAYIDRASDTAELMPILYSLPKNLLLKSAVHRHLAGTPDFFVICDRNIYGLEIKTARFEAGWAQPTREDGETFAWASRQDIPIQYYIQVQSYLAMMPSITRWDVAVLIGGQKMWVYHFKRDEAMIASIIEASGYIHSKYISDPTAALPPELMEKAKQGVTAMYPVSTAGKTLNMEKEPAFTEAAMGYSRLNILIKILEGAKATVRTTMLARLADAEKAVFEGGSVSYKSTKETTTVDTARAYELLLDYFKENQPSVYDFIVRFLEENKEKYTIRKPGSRRFLVTTPSITNEAPLEELYAGVQELAKSAVDNPVSE